MLESMCSIKKIVAKAANLGYSALAMTDIGNMHGVVKFYEECLANNIKPIIGLEISVDINEQVVPIYLYAKDNFGYLNLMRLASASKINNDRVSYSTLSNLASSLKIVIPFYEPAWSSTFIDDVNYKMTYTVMLGIIDHLKLITPFVYAGIISNCENNDLISLIDNFIRQVNLNKILTDKVTYINSDDKEALQVLKAIKDNYQLDNQYTIDNYLINPSVLSKMNQELLEATYNFSKDITYLTPYYIELVNKKSPRLL
jgi:DNA polymerase-3 subunit alpha